MRRKERSEQELFTSREELCLFLKETIKENIGIAMKERFGELKFERLQGSEELLKPIPLVSTSDIRRRWGKSRTTIIKACKNGLKPSGKAGRQFTFNESEVMKVFGLPYIQ